ncbi:type II toxin-antitoxin system RelE/ParE family toxin [Halocola ammonii]
MQVYVTPRAERDFNRIIRYIRKKWGDSTAQEFIHKSDAIFKLLRHFPSIGAIEVGEIRGFQLTPQTRILYRIKADKIVILSFFQVRQNPNKKSSND